MQARVHGRLQMCRSKVGRRSQQNDVDPAVDQPLVAVRTAELAVRRHVDFLRDVLLFGQSREAQFHPIRKSVRHRGQPRSRVRMQRLDRRPRPSPAAPHQADAQDIATSGVHSPRLLADCHGEAGCGSRSRAVFQKLPA